MPRDEFPGATDVGVINYIENWISIYYPERAEFYKRGIAALQSHCSAKYSEPFQQLDFDTQESILKDMERGRLDKSHWSGISQTEFFGEILDRSMQGFYGNPRHGGVIAKELACSGMKTVLFERGSWATYDYHPNDELMNQRLHIIGAVHGSDRRKSPYVEVAKVGSIVKSRPDRPDYTIIAACVGSGTVSYGAMAWRFMPQDFRLKSIYGCPEGSTLAD